MNFKKSQEKNQEKKQVWHRYVVRYGKKADETVLNFKPAVHIKKISKTQYIKGFWGEMKVKTGEFKDPYGGKHSVEKSERKFFSDGEVFEMKQKTPDKDGVMRNKRSLRKIFTDMRRLIYLNFTDNSPNQLIITLTYAENMTDCQRLQTDFNKFMLYLRRNLQEHELAYIVVMEPQGRGAWHCHLLLKSLNKPSLFIPFDDLNRLWPYGMTDVKMLNADDIGSYFVAYMSNAELDDEKIKALEIPDDDIKVSSDKNGQPKKYIKGTRLSMYPDSMQIYRHSRNIKNVDRTYITMDDLRKLYPDIVYVGNKSIELSDGRILIIKRTQRKVLPDS